jgi:rare lipoprotein A
VRRALPVFLLALTSSPSGSPVRNDVAYAAPSHVRSLPPSHPNGAFAPPPAETVKGRTPASAVGFATYYARRLHGRMTASGIPFDTDAMVAGHPTYPFGTIVRVTNLRNGLSAEVEIVDRGPARSARRTGVIVDVSRAAAECLDFVRAGRARVRVDVLSHAETATVSECSGRDRISPRAKRLNERESASSRPVNRAGRQAPPVKRDPVR